MRRRLPMNRIDLLKKNYQRLCEYSWDRNVAGAQRLWIAVYDKEDERKLRLRLRLFEEATLHSGHKWMAIDLTDAFANWLLVFFPGVYEQSNYRLLDARDGWNYHAVP